MLEPGASQALEFSFSPSEVAEAAASLQLTSDDPISPTASVALHGVGVSSVLAVSPTRVDFGTVLAPARSLEQILTLTNVSNDPVVLGPATLSGSRPEHFTLGFLPRPLAPGESTTATVTWRTEMAAESSARLDLDLAEPSQARAASVELQGRAVGRFLELEPMSVDFGGVNLGQESEPALITLTNHAAVPMTVQRLLSSNEVFRVDPLGMEGPLLPGQSGSFLVSFQPKEQGPASGEVRVVSRGEGATELSLSVEGRGGATRVEGGGYTCGSTGGGSMLGLLGALLLFSRRR